MEILEAEVDEAVEELGVEVPDAPEEHEDVFPVASSSMACFRCVTVHFDELLVDSSDNEDGGRCWLLVMIQLPEHEPVELSL